MSRVRDLPGDDSVLADLVRACGISCDDLNSRRATQARRMRGLRQPGGHRAIPHPGKALPSLRGSDGLRNGGRAGGKLPVMNYKMRVLKRYRNAKLVKTAT